MTAPGPEGAGPVVVVDVGGTTLRSAVHDPRTGRLSDVRRVPVDGMARDPAAPVAVLRHRVTAQIVHAVSAHAARAGTGRPAAVGVAFAGPVTAAGLVTAAPTVWGPGGDPLPLGELLAARLGAPVTVVNDLTAAAWRYAATETGPFCLITVSSGIGNKVFRGGEVLLDPGGHGGELGHWVADPSPGAPRCDCGGRGHLGAIASGRGVLAAARRAAVADPAGFAASRLAARCGGGAAAFRALEEDAAGNRALAAAVRDGDPFATEVLRGTLTHLARAVSAVFTSIGVGRYLLVGGFALAVGEPYRRLLVGELRRLGCFGKRPEEIDAMVALGHPDDDHGLIGMGRLLAAARPAALTAEGAR
jgi:glucokinase